MCVLTVTGKYDRRTTIALDNAGRGNADHAAMPALTIDHNAPGVAYLRIRGQRGVDLVHDARLFGLAIAIQVMQLLRDGTCFDGVANAEELDDIFGDVHAPGGVEARRDAEGDIAGVNRLGDVHAGNFENGF